MAGHAPLNSILKHEIGSKPVGWLHLAVNPNHEVEKPCKSESDVRRAN